VYGESVNTLKQLLNRWRCSGSERCGAKAEEVDIWHDVAESRRAQ